MEEARGLEDDALIDELLQAEEAIRSAQARKAALIAVVQERVHAAG